MPWGKGSLRGFETLSAHRRGGYHRADDAQAGASPRVGLVRALPGAERGNGRLSRPRLGHPDAPDGVRGEGVLDRLRDGDGRRGGRGRLPTAVQPDRVDLLRDRRRLGRHGARRGVRALGAHPRERSPGRGALRRLAAGMALDPAGRRARGHRRDLSGWTVPLARLASRDLDRDPRSGGSDGDRRADSTTDDLHRTRQPRRCR